TSNRLGGRRWWWTHGSSAWLETQNELCAKGTHSVNDLLGRIRGLGAFECAVEGREACHLHGAKRIRHLQKRIEELLELIPFTKPLFNDEPSRADTSKQSFHLVYRANDAMRDDDPHQT